MKKVLKHPIFAQHSTDSITVYQAYSEEIGLLAARHATLDVAPFSKTRMTWVKPSFLWMMYRSNWGYKDAKQKVILEIKLTRRGFVEFLRESCLSSFDSTMYADKEAWQADLNKHPNRVQWDPDKDIDLVPQDRRAIQLGIAPRFVPLYLESIISLTDITAKAHQIKQLFEGNEREKAMALLPTEPEIEAQWFL